MADPYLGEIRLMSFNFPPNGWALCNGQLYPKNQNLSLFGVLGTTFGGDGIVNFAFPDLRGRTPIHVGNGHTLGERGGQPTHTLSVAELPTHTHAVQASTRTADLAPGAGQVPAKTLTPTYGPPQTLVTMKSEAVSSIGGNQAHLNLQPYLVISFCIALQGTTPSI